MINNNIYIYIYICEYNIINYNNEWEMTVAFPSIHISNKSIPKNESFYERGNSVFCFSTIF